MKSFHCFCVLLVPTVILVVVLHRIILQHRLTPENYYEVFYSRDWNNGEQDASSNGLLHQNAHQQHSIVWDIVRNKGIRQLEGQTEISSEIITQQAQSEIKEIEKEQNSEFKVVQDLCDALCNNTKSTDSLIIADNQPPGQTETLNIVGNKSTIISRVNLLISAGMRTGSSFVSQLINSHPDFFFLFEPLYGLKDVGDNGPELAVSGVHLLSRIYSCDFSVHGISQYFNWYNTLSSWQRDNTCQSMNEHRAKNCCLATKHMATKVIRLLDVRDFVPLMQDLEMDLKVISVVRDPRAMMTSVIPLYLSGYTFDRKTANMIRDVKDLDDVLLERLKRYCDINLRNHALVTSKVGSLFSWKANVLQLRFEDIASDPRKTVDTIYKFIGLKTSSQVYEWITNNTNVDEKVLQKRERYGYMTQRNSTEVVSKWRRQVTLELVKAIQNTGVCARYMQVFGYESVNNAYQLHDDTFNLYV
ncbi:carbohydrate sulfotransferase 1-like [Saccoglossus kowalevskii]